MKKKAAAALVLLLTGCGTMVKIPKLPADALPQEEARKLFHQYRVTEKGNFFFKEYTYNGTFYGGHALSPLFDAPWIQKSTASRFDLYNVYNVAAITGALGGGFSLVYNFGNMASDKKTANWAWISGGTGLAAMVLLKYLAAKTATDTLTRYNLDLKIKLGLVPEEDEMTSPDKKKHFCAP